MWPACVQVVCSGDSWLSLPSARNWTSPGAHLPRPLPGLVPSFLSGPHRPRPFLPLPHSLCPRPGTPDGLCPRPISPLEVQLRVVSLGLCSPVQSWVVTKHLLFSRLWEWGGDRQDAMTTPLADLQKAPALRQRGTWGPVEPPGRSLMERLLPHFTAGKPRLGAGAGWEKEPQLAGAGVEQVPGLLPEAAQPSEGPGLELLPGHPGQGSGREG